MSTKRDYYEILGLTKTATASEIKSAYKKMALKWHPDRNGKTEADKKAAEEKFKEINEAYQILSDTKKKQTYDQYGHEGLQGSGFSGFHGFEDIFSSFGDIFEEFFGFGRGRRTRTQAQRGADLRYDLTLEFMEAAFGVEKEIELVKRETCHLCSGSGCSFGCATTRYTKWRSYRIGLQDGVGSAVQGQGMDNGFTRA